MTTVAKNTSRKARSQQTGEQLAIINDLVTSGFTIEDFLAGEIGNIKLYKPEIPNKEKDGVEPPCVLLLASNGEEVWLKQFSGSCKFGSLVGYEGAIPLTCLQGDRRELTAKQKFLLFRINRALNFARNKNPKKSARVA